MSIRFVALEGPHGAGKTTLARRTHDALHAQRAKGILFPRWARNVLFCHTRPASMTPGASMFTVEDPVLAALDYAVQRRRFVLGLGESSTEDVLVLCDRYALSTLVLATALEHTQPAVAAELLALYNAEKSWRKHGVRHVLVDASDETLAERLTARGSAPTQTELAERDAVRSLAASQHWPTVRTDDPSRDALEHLLELLRQE